MSIFAVQTIPQGQEAPRFVVVAAANPPQALSFAVELSMAENQPDTIMVAVFSLEEIEALAAAMRQAIDSQVGSPEV